MGKLNCWEFKKCGRELGGAQVDDLGICPASIDAASTGINSGVNGGRSCWSITGTFCGGVVQGTFAHKQLSCMTCDFFKLVKNEGKQEGSYTLQKV